MANEQVGLDAIWNNENFNKGQTQYIAGLTKATGVTDQFASKIGTSGAAGASAFTGGLAAAGGGVLGFAAIIGGTIAIVGKLVDGIIAAGQKMVAFGTESLMTASRVQQLNYIAQILGQKAGYTSQEINGIVDSVRAEGIAMGVANNLVAQFLRSNLDLAQATQLAKVAQDSATLANIGSSEALDKLIYGIQTLQPEVLRTAGITISLEQAYKEYAQTMGKVVTELTPAEKKQIALNAVLAEGAKVAGAYDASMESAGKQMGTLTSRLIPDLQATLGAPLQTAFFNVISGINGMIIGITKLFSEGGALYPVLINIGAALALITEPFKNLGDAFKSGDAITAFSEWASTVSDTIQNVIDSAYQWGVDLAAQFADGIIQGASTLIQQAINWVSSLLTSWFQPKSPPKVASNIDKWGAGTINQWLKGFTEGDFAILDTLQGPLERALNAMVDSGDIGEQAAFEKMQQINTQMMQALSSGDTLGEDFFKNIENSAGDFGGAISDLARKQYELQMAEKGVAQAEKDIQDARKRSADAGKQVNELTAEYNRMLRSGASKGALDAKKKEIGLAKQVQTQAQKDEEAAKAKLESEKASIDLMKEQLALQKKLVDQLLEAAKIMKDTGADKGGAGGGAPLPEPPGGGGGGDITGIVDKIKEQVEAAKTVILAKLALLWQEIQNRWAMGVAALGKQWDKLVTWAGDTWNKIAAYFGLPSWQEIQMAWNTATQWIAEQVEWLTDTLLLWWTEHGKSVKGVLDGFWLAVQTGWKLWLIGLSEGLKFWIGVFTQFWTDHGEAITEFLTLTLENIKLLFSNALEGMGNVFDFWAAIFQGNWALAWQEVLDNISLSLDTIKIVWETFLAFLSTSLQMGLTTIQTFWSTAWTAISTAASAIWDVINTGLVAAFEGFRGVIEGAMTSLQEWWATTWETISTTVTSIWEVIKTNAAAAITGPTGLVSTITGGIDGLLETLGGYVSQFAGFGASIMEGATDGVLGAMQGMIDAVVGAIQDAIAAAQEALDWHSPSKVFRRMFQDTMKGAELGVQDEQGRPARAIGAAMTQAIGAARQPMASTPITTGNTYNRSLAINMQNSISGGMSAAQFSAMVVQTVRTELRR